jgi:hypothetical protein
LDRIFYANPDMQCEPNASLCKSATCVNQDELRTQAEMWPAAGFGMPANSRLPPTIHGMVANGAGFATPSGTRGCGLGFTDGN